MTNRIDNYSQDSDLQTRWSRFDADVMKISENNETEFLRGQLTILEQELDCENQLTQVCTQELTDAKRELKRMEKELQTAIAVKIMGIEHAKEIAKSIANSNMSVADSLALMLSIIYNSSIESTDLYNMSSSVSDDKVAAETSGW